MACAGQEPELVPQVGGDALGWVNPVVFGAHSNWLATTDKHGVVLIYDLAGGHIARRIQTGSSDVLIAPDLKGNSLAIAEESHLELYEVEGGKSLWKVSLAQACQSIHFNDDGSRIIGVCNPVTDAPDGPQPRSFLRYWNTSNGLELSSTPVPAGFSAGGPFSEDGRWVVATAIPDTKVSGPLASIRKSMRAIKALQDHPILDTQTGEIIGRVHALRVQGLSRRSHSAIVTTISYSKSAMMLQRVDVLTGKVLQTYKGGAPVSSALISADGKHFVLSDLDGASIIDAADGTVNRPKWQGVPALSSIGIAQNLDTVAFVQGGSVLVSSISKPEQIRTVGSPADSGTSQFIRNSLSQGLGTTGDIEVTSTPSRAGSIAKVIAGNFVGGSTNPNARAELINERELERQCEAKVKPVRKKDRIQALSECLNTSMEAKQKQTESGQEKTYFDSISRFGGPVTFPPIAVSLDSGRLLAIFCADFTWGLWDTATGNRLPYRHPLYPGAQSYMGANGAFFTDGLRAIEREFGVMQRTEFDFSGKTQPKNKTIAADGAQYYTYFPAKKKGDEDAEPTGGEGIHVWDAASDKPLFDLPAPFASLALPVVAPGGKTLVAADAFNTVGIWDRHTGARLGTLYALQEGEWLITTPSGLFDGSPRGWSEIAWREPGGGISTLPAEAFFNEFYRPGLLAELLDGHPPQPPRTITVVDRRQPKLAIASDEATTSRRIMNLHLSLSEAPADSQRNTGSGIRDVRLFRNGTLVRAWRGDLPLKSGQADLDETVKLVAGENRFVAYAFNRENVKSADAVVTIQSTASARQGTAYILSIGVNQYTNPEFNLNFAAPDAQHLTQALTGHLQALGQYRQVVGVELLNEQATKANMLLALSILGGRAGGSLPGAAAPQLADLRPVQPEDMVVVYFAGHGVARRDRFYLVPHDLGYSGPRDEVLGSLDQLLKSSVSDLQLEQSFESIDAAHSLLIIDACNSGKVLDAEEERRGPMNSKGLAQLAYEKGIYVLTASQAYQSAFESSRLGYGYLTFALAKEGLESAVADTRPIDGKVSAVEWFEYASRRVPEMQSEVLNRSVVGTVPAFERSYSSGNGQPSGLQTPRVYYRRDLPGGEAIVAKFP